MSLYCYSLNSIGTPCDFIAKKWADNFSLEDPSLETVAFDHRRFLVFHPTEGGHLRWNKSCVHIDLDRLSSGIWILEQTETITKLFHVYRRNNRLFSLVGTLNGKQVTLLPSSTIRTLKPLVEFYAQITVLEEVLKVKGLIILQRLEVWRNHFNELLSMN